MAKHILADSDAPERINQAIDWLPHAAESGLDYMGHKSDDHEDNPQMQPRP